MEILGLSGEMWIKIFSQLKLNDQISLFTNELLTITTKFENFTIFTTRIYFSLKNLDIY